jgi:hypothetical protein
MKTKLIGALLDVFGVPMSLTILLLNWRDFKGDIMFALTATIITIRLVFDIEKKIHEARVRRWEFNQRKKEANGAGN